MLEFAKSTGVKCVWKEEWPIMLMETRIGHPIRSWYVNAYVHVPYCARIRLDMCMLVGIIQCKPASRVSLVFGNNVYVCDCACMSAIV